MKGDLGIEKNYRDISLTAIAAKVYNNLLLNPILALSAGAVEYTGCLIAEG